MFLFVYRKTSNSRPRAHVTKVVCVGVCNKSSRCRFRVFRRACRMPRPSWRPCFVHVEQKFQKQAYNFQTSLQEARIKLKIVLYVCVIKAPETGSEPSGKPAGGPCEARDYALCMCNSNSNLSLQVSLEDVHTRPKIMLYVCVIVTPNRAFKRVCRMFIRGRRSCFTYV